MSHARTKGGPTEIPFKQWCADEAKRQGVTPDAIAWRVKQGKYPKLNIRRLNQRVLFVRVGMVLLLGLLCGCGESKGVQQLNRLASHYERLVEFTATNACERGFLLGVEWERKCRRGEITNDTQAREAMAFVITNWLATRPGKLR